MSPRTAERPADPRAHPRVRRVPPTLLVATATLVGLFATTRALAGPSFVRQIALVNPTPYAVDVEVTGAERDGWVQLGEAKQAGTTVYHEVIDQGATWIIRFADGEGGELRLTRAALERSRWRVEIPASMEARLRPAWGPPELLA
jgi:hypothetical protein